MTRHIVVLVTAPSAETAHQIADALLERRLVAAVNAVPAVESRYWWAGEVRDAQEWMLVVKTRAALFERVVSVVQARHPYEVPQIIALPIVMGAESYLDWLDATTE